MLYEFDEEIIAANKTVTDFCRFLASIYLYELTDEQVEDFAHIKWEKDGSHMDRGYAMIHEYLRHRNTATRQELAVDYAHTYLGAGVYDEIMAPPYESVFTSKQRLLMQVARDGALKYYRSEKLGLGKDNSTPEDHLGFELQFMAEIVERASQALRDGDQERFVELVQKQSSFFKYHQENWLPDFCDATDKYARTDFYRGIAELTRGYLEIVRGLLDEVAEACEITLEDIELRPAWADEDEEFDEKQAFASSAFTQVKAEARKLGAVMPRNE